MIQINMIYPRFNPYSEEYIMIYKNFSQKDFDEAEKAYNECAKKRIKPAGTQEKKLSKGQTTALFIAFLIFLYSIFTSDIPAFLFSLAFFLWMLRNFAGKINAHHEKSIHSLLTSFSITLFIGSLILLFI